MAMGRSVACGTASAKNLWTFDGIQSLAHVVERLPIHEAATDQDAADAFGFGHGRNVEHIFGEDGGFVVGKSDDRGLALVRCRNDRLRWHERALEIFGLCL